MLHSVRTTAILIASFSAAAALVWATDPAPGKRSATSTEKQTTPPAEEAAPTAEENSAQDTETPTAPIADDPAAADEQPAAAGDGTTYDLVYKFQPGEVVRWKVVHQAAIDTTIQTTNQTAETRSTSIKEWKIGTVTPDGQITFVHSVESVDMWQKTQGRQAVRYNSKEDKEVPSGYQDVAKAVGVPLTRLTIDKRGNEVSREELYPQPNTKSTLITVPLPDKPVEIGHTWSVPLDVDVSTPSGGSKKIATRQRLTLAEVVDGVATIQSEMQVLTPLSDPAIEAQLLQRMTSGKLQFDIARGRIIRQQLDLDRRVIGFSGAASSMHCLTRFTEEVQPVNKPAAAVAKKTAPPAKSVVGKTPTSKPAPAAARAAAAKTAPALTKKQPQPIKQPARR